MKQENNPKILLTRYIIVSILILIFLSDIFTQNLSKLLTLISYYYLSIFTNVQLIDNQLIFPNGAIFLIIKECVAISAYILISIIFLTLPINPKKIYKEILNSYFVFTIFNLVRILILMTVHIKLGETAFNQIHVLFYEFISGVGVAIIVIYYLKKLKIKKMYPVISDIIYLIKEIFKTKK